jgi:hypothetical protein
MEIPEVPDREVFTQLMKNRPFGDFDDLAPEDVYSLVFDVLDPEKTPLTLESDVDDDLIKATKLYADVIKYLTLLKDRQPLKLTQRGNLPRAFCRELCAMGIIELEPFHCNEFPIMSELDAPYIHYINVITRGTGLTRKVHEKLGLTKRAEKHLAVGKPLDLYKRLFFAHLLKFNWAYEDIYPHSTILQAGATYMMFLVGKYGESARGVSFYADKFVSAFPFVANDFGIGFAWTPLAHFRSCLYARMFEGFLGRFGLVEIEGKDSWRSENKTIRKTLLFDRLIRLRRGAPLISEAKSTQKKTFERVWQFKITLKDTNPPIWRRIQVPETYTFWDLHVAIQDAMGWSDYHLHEFEMLDPTTRTGTCIGLPAEESLPGIRSLLGWQQRIADWFTGDRKSMDYNYDFGDGWEHEVLLEKVLPRQEESDYPICIGGKRACPPEDVGGPYGYETFLEALSDPSHRDHKMYVEWIGCEFDSEHFDPSGVKFDDPEFRLKLAMNPL